MFQLVLLEILTD